MNATFQAEQQQITK